MREIVASEATGRAWLSARNSPACERACPPRVNDVAKVQDHLSRIVPGQRPTPRPQRHAQSRAQSRHVGRAGQTGEIRRRRVYSASMALNIRRVLGLSAILTGITTTALMQTMLTTSMPQISLELQAGSVYGWVFTSYLLASTLPLPLLSHLADHRSRRTFFLGGLILYMAGTACAALASSGSNLVTARILQGLGAASLVPAALGAVGDIAGQSRARLFGVIGAVQTSASILGPLLGGWFTDGPGWRAGLWALIPIGTLSALTAMIGMPAKAHTTWAQACQSFDVSEPVRTLVIDHHMRAVATSTVIVGCSTMTAAVYVPLLVQSQFGESAKLSGAALIPLMAGIGVGSIVGGLTAKDRSRPASRLAWAALAGGVVGLILLSVLHSPLGWILTCSVFIGLGTGTLMPILLTQAQSISGEEATARASALLQFARNIGGAFGTIVLGYVIQGLVA